MCGVIRMFTNLKNVVNINGAFLRIVVDLHTIEVLLLYHCYKERPFDVRSYGVYDM